MDPATAVLDRYGHTAENSYRVLSDLSGVPASTLGHRKRGRKSIQQRAADQQYLTLQEEKALVSYFLKMSRNGYPLPVKFAGNLAYVIKLIVGSLTGTPTSHSLLVGGSEFAAEANLSR
jgi:hypothetical protein